MEAGWISPTYLFARDQACDWDALLAIFDVLFTPAARTLPSFPQIVGGVRARWFDSGGAEHSVSDLAEVQQAYKNKVTLAVEFSGAIGDVRGSFVRYDPGLEPTRLIARLRVHPGGEQVILDVIGAQGFEQVTESEFQKRQRKVTLDQLAVELANIEQSEDVPEHRRRQVRGTRFEHWLKRFFEAFGLTPTLNVVNPGEQIDFTDWLANYLLIGEARWRADAVGEKQIRDFYGKLIERPPFAIGMIISMSGFSDAGMEYIRRRSGERTVLTMGRAELETILSGRIELTDWLLESLRNRLEHP